MKIVFLDFDGVLNSFRFIDATSMRERLDPAAVARLNAILARSGAKVVVSSTWRVRRSVEELRRVLDKVGFEGEVIDKTPVLENHGIGDPFVVRAMEIRAWLDAQTQPIESYVVIDDGWIEDLAHVLVKTETDTGLGDEHIDAALDLLNFQP
jgi:hypothetical protein